MVIVQGAVAPRVIEMPSQSTWGSIGPSTGMFLGNYEET